jgi:vacuolar-type H+-ATPase subunit E/Vma4
MSIESMLVSLDQEAELEKKKILEESERQIDQIRKDAEKSSSEIRQNYSRQAKEAMDLEEAKLMGNAKSKANSLLLETRRKEFEHAFNEAKKRIHQLSQGTSPQQSSSLKLGLGKEADYPQLFQSLVQESLNGISGKVAAEVSPQDVNLAQEIFRKFKREVEIKSNPKISGGVLIRSQDMRQVIENTFDSRLLKAFNILTTEVAQKLWPQKS